MKKLTRALTIAASMLVVSILIIDTASADTVDFSDNGTFITSSLTEGNVTVTGSDDVQVLNNAGLGIVGGVSPTVIDSSETMSFDFTNPVSNVVIDTYESFDTDGSGTVALNATLLGVSTDNSITVTSIQFDGSSPIDVSGILGIASMLSFDITMNIDAIRVRTISFDVDSAPLDTDSDGVLDGDDNCPNTIIPESLPARSLGVNRFALVDGDNVFDTTSPNGVGPRRSYTIDDTAGCSCTQIIDALGLGNGHTKFGCSISAMDDWVDLVNP